MIKAIYDALVACKYRVSLIPQEKRPNREITFKLSDIGIDVSDSQLYVMPITVSLEWNDDKVLEIPTYIIKVMKDVEEYFFANNTEKRGTFRWTTVACPTAGGSQYNISLKCMYMEEIQID